jgi:hypothetical protein
LSASTSAGSKVTGGSGRRFCMTLFNRSGP